LRIAEDRGIESAGRLEAIGKGKSIYAKLVSYFQQADERYNSGLFHFRKGDGDDETLDRFTLKLKIDDRALRDIISNLYPPKSPYAFSVIPADILGQVYERFLGRVIYVRARTIKIEEKPDVKKAGGVYYTPSFVVREIIRKTLGQLLQSKTVGEVSGERRTKAAVRILDPACGSGSFLIEAYQYLLDWYLAEYMKSPEDSAKGRRPKLHKAAGGVWRLTIA
jgi:type I restriction-modification system DNA methylase subunit